MLIALFENKLKAILFYYEIQEVSSEKVKRLKRQPNPNEQTKKCWQSKIKSEDKNYWFNRLIIKKLS